LSQHVVVVGGGVVGRFTALYARRRGFDVTLADRDPAGSRGCSFGNAGMVVPSHFVPLAAPGMVRLGVKWMFDPASPFRFKPRASQALAGWTVRFWRAATPEHVRRAAPLLRDLALASRACYEALAGESGNRFGLECNGMLVVSRADHGWQEERHAAEQARALGIPATVLERRDAVAFDPCLREDIAGAVHYPLDCHLVPDRLLAWLDDRLDAEGVRVRRSTEVTGFVRDRSLLRAATTPAGDIAGDTFVVCGGVWSPSLVRSLGVRIPIEAGKGYTVTVPKPPELRSHCAILSEARVAVTPMGGDLRIGGTLELAGIDASIDPVRVRAIADAVPRYYRSIDVEALRAAQPWAGLRPCSPDGLPYVGRTSKVANLIVAAGHAMMGVSLGPVTGRIVADLVAGERPEFDMSQLSPDRYG
jgi:D-amino-acid dehydrogenase